MKIYAISGLGADERVFQKLRLKHEIIPIPWKSPLKREKLHDYAKRLAVQVNTNEAYIIMGVSFGGLVAIEMSKFLNPVLTIQISSATTRKELPWIYKLVGKTGIIPYLPIGLFKLTKGVVHRFFKPKDKALLNAILEDSDWEFGRWAINELTSWKNEEAPAALLKISGDKDLILPPKNIDKRYLIRGGGHFMIVDNHKELSELINAEVKTHLSGLKT